MALKKIIFFLLLSSSIFSQSFLINSNHVIYDYLSYLRTIGEADNYDNLILPISNKKISKLIDSLRLTEFSTNYSFNKVQDSTISFLDNFSAISNSFYTNYEYNIINYTDSVIHFSANPIFSTKVLNKNSNNSLVIFYGGQLKLNYGSNITAFLEANNGYIGGSVEAARLEKKVNQSFSVISTKIKYADYTRGYINYESEVFSGFLGRNEIVWGVSKLNPLVIGTSSQDFDFIKFEINYKKFNYIFLHGWLVTKRTSAYVDSLTGDIRRKTPKYIAISRLGYNPTKRLKFGVTQTIIYANRPVELAYLNPFLLFESAQRSLNDLDNSFLGFDFRYMPFNGLEVIGNLIFDDINFNLWGSGAWNTPNNRLAWQIDFNLAYPLLPKNFMLLFDYTQVRPFTFTHPEINESLSYTNNGFPLGTYLNPNSVAFSVQLNYFINKNFLTSVRYDNIKHGENEYDNNGNLVFNYGGAYNLSTTSILSSKNPKLLDGILSKKNRVTFLLKYYYSYFVNINFSFSSEKEKIRSNNITNNNFIFTLNYNIF